ncbi:hypothetical protein E1292_21055 [Nonomuraea deserti]|uniref:Uncharacterized protein n=1 Tax=Nonomuraea deserti TaxID=1848322 RepID=A0A4R4VMR5_9ACTN|nr:hypothetical protein E1292_21055 [Nonomuraea deserti]
MPQAQALHRYVKTDSFWEDNVTLKDLTCATPAVQPTKTAAKKHCDEFPFNATLEGTASTRWDYSAVYVNDTENETAGKLLSLSWRTAGSYTMTRSGSELVGQSTRAIDAGNVLFAYGPGGGRTGRSAAGKEAHAARDFGRRAIRRELPPVRRGRSGRVLLPHLGRTRRSGRGRAAVRRDPGRRP